MITLRIPYRSANYDNFIKARNWCKEFCGDRYTIDIHGFHFETEQDALMFRLKWLCDK